jgi:hypothetical protein
MYMKETNTECLQIIRTFYKNFMSVLYSSGKRWNYFLLMLAKETFWFSPYNCVLLIFVRVLLPYQ